MRYLIFGAGAIGGVVGARLHQAGCDVVLIARGAHRDAIARDGLTLETPDERVTLRIPVVPDPAGAGIGADDVVLLATKGQDTWAALLALREAVPAGVPVVCLQNGVENERVALRLFSHVYGAVVMSPTAHLEPGVVQAYATTVTGSIDIGRYPSGIDTLATEICAGLAAARFESTPRERIMDFKYAKLINNLANAVQAICGIGESEGRQELAEAVQAEGRAILRSAGIAFDVEDVADLRGRWTRWGVREIAGRPRGGGSTWQSVTRGATIETDYLNGEIVLIGRTLGHSTPVNELLQSLAHETMRDGHTPGWLSPHEILARLESP